MPFPALAPILIRRLPTENPNIFIDVLRGYGDDDVEYKGDMYRVSPSIRLRKRKRERVGVKALSLDAFSDRDISFEPCRLGGLVVGGDGCSGWTVIF